MKYVIISIYDGMYGFDVLENGEHIEAEREKEIGKKLCELRSKRWPSYELVKNDDGEWHEVRLNEVHYFLKDYYKDYDLIIISEDGCAEVVKDTTKENQNDIT